MKQIVKLSQKIQSNNFEKLLGNKGANLYRLYNKFNVPRGFILTSLLYKIYKQNSNQKFISYIIDQIHTYIIELQKQTAKQFGTTLKVSVRASGYYIMPGMMLTFLNVKDYNQLYEAIINVYKSYNSLGAKKYREINNISEQSGPAIIIQEMIYGDKNQFSYTGVFSTKNIKTGQNKLYGEFLHQESGQKLLSGLKPAIPLQLLPIKLYNQLNIIAKSIEQIYLPIQEVEFTIENNIIYILQCRQAILSPFAKIKILYEQYINNKISKNYILQNLTYQDFQIISNYQQIDFDKSNLQFICNGASISFNSICGKLTFNPLKTNENNILYIQNTMPDYIKYVNNISGIIASNGGATSHLSSILREQNKSGIIINDLIYQNNYIYINNIKIFQNQYITIDGFNNSLFKGKAIFKTSSKYLFYLNFFINLFEE